LDDEEDEETLVQALEMTIGESTTSEVHDDDVAAAVASTCKYTQKKTYFDKDVFMAAVESFQKDTLLPYLLNGKMVGFTREKSWTKWTAAINNGVLRLDSAVPRPVSYHFIRKLFEGMLEINFVTVDIFKLLSYSYESLAIIGIVEYLSA